MSTSRRNLIHWLVNDYQRLIDRALGSGFDFVGLGGRTPTPFCCQYFSVGSPRLPPRSAEPRVKIHRSSRHFLPKSLALVLRVSLLPGGLAYADDTQDYQMQKLDNTVDDTTAGELRAACSGEWRTSSALFDRRATVYSDGEFKTIVARFNARHHRTRPADLGPRDRFKSRSVST